MASAAASIRERVMAAGARIKRVKRVDRFATGFITLGGIFIVVSVSFIFLFIFGQAVPLFRSAGGRSLPVLTLAAPPAGTAAAPAGTPLAFGLDEYQMYLYELLPDGRLAFFKTTDGSFAREFALPSLSGVAVTAGARSLTGDYVAAGTSDGRVALQQVHAVPRYQDQRLVDLDLEVRDRGLLELDPAKRPVRAVAYQERESWQAVAALVADDEIAVYRRNQDDATEERSTVRVPSGEKVTALQLGRTDTLAVGTSNGRLYLWELEGTPRLVSGVSPSDQAVTALEYSLGANSLIVGDGTGAVSGWFRVRLKDEDSDLSLVRAHQYAGQGQAITAIAQSARDRSFVTAGADGALVLRHFTSERSVLSFPATGLRPADAMLTPRADGIVVRRADGTLARYEIRNPHPEVSWRALFGKVWYEGYPQPEYVWQSTGATDDFESKFSLVPLVFGTIKGTLYAMLFAVPLAIMAALYTSQFAHPNIRQRIKPVVEIMAALPSVVVGFIAGLWLASRVETQIVPVLLMVALLPAFGSSGVLLWDRLPHGLRKRLKPGMELAVIVPLAAVGAFLALKVGPGVEGSLFGGDFKHWLSTALGLVYDQRNSLVVGLAMGFAVIPIIFTISEDSFSSVPSHLTAASLALGASRWQTALRVVLPTASPGIFSAVMVGFGRAVGETMIVLMATGNTPVLDWSIFNGMRTLSANIAVEIPEAPYGGTLYRVLFLAGGVLFLMTFFVNTIAELIRQRLRERYPGALMSLRKSFQRGEHLIWLTGSALAACLLMIAGLVVVILTNGLGFFWPSPLTRVTLKDGSTFLGEVVNREAIPNPGHPDHLQNHRLQLKVGNRDLLGFDFKWIDEADITAREQPKGVFLVERREYGPLLGTPVALKQGDRVVAEGAGPIGQALPALLDQAVRDRKAVEHIEKDQIGAINYRIEQARLRKQPVDPALEQQYQVKQEELARLMAGASRTSVTFKAEGGAEKELRTFDIFRVYAANELGLPQRLSIYLSRLWHFVADDPRESNTEGGIFPAIFGTVMMVFVMSLIVVPLGVLAALYLREYAKQGPMVRLVRIAVNNLAGVPSIVFGVFGLGFFVYFMGGSIDRLFFADALPTPTFGTGGILWASLTLALLTVPVVIVASEEALAAVPRSMREASLAMGATKFQTILRVVLPAAAPGILTGLILAMARGAGEVAPLMLTGVVKLAPQLPLDGWFPFFHFDRKFMHLGFHIYDVGFQSPNVEAAKPMVYTTTIFLLMIVVALNFTAIVVRNRLRRKYQTSAF